MNLRHISWSVAISFLIVTTLCAPSSKRDLKTSKAYTLLATENAKGKDSLLTPSVYHDSNGSLNTAISVRGNFGSCNCAFSKTVMQEITVYGKLEDEKYEASFTQGCLGKLKEYLAGLKFIPKVFAIEYNGQLVHVSRKHNQKYVLQAKSAVTKMAKDLLAMLEKNNYDYALGKVYSLNVRSYLDKYPDLTMTAVSQGRCEKCVPSLGEGSSEVSIYSQGTGKDGRTYGQTPAITLTLMKPRPYPIEPGELYPVADPLIFEDAEVRFNEDLVVLAPSEES